MASRRANSTSTGRKKIEIRPIESEEARKVCFSRRRTGLFNKLSELSTMCGAEVAAVAFSPGGKAFSFGHPSVESVLDRIRTSKYSSEALQVVAAMDGSSGGGNRALEELNRERGEVRAQLAAIKARNKAVAESLAKARAEGCQAAAWLELANDVSQMGAEDLVAFAAALAKVRADVAVRCDQVLQDALIISRTMRGGGYEFERGGSGTSACGMEMTQQQQQQLNMMMEELMMELAPPGADMVQQQQI
jgi:hypothetical protein